VGTRLHSGRGNSPVCSEDAGSSARAGRGGAEGTIGQEKKWRFPNPEAKVNVKSIYNHHERTGHSYKACELALQKR